MLLQLAKVQKGKVSWKRKTDKRTGEAQTGVNKGSQGSGYCPFPMVPAELQGNSRERKFLGLKN